MINNRTPQANTYPGSFWSNCPLLLLTGVLIGGLTGLAGIGSGFLADTSADRIDWAFLLVVAALAVVIILLGSYMSQFSAGPYIRRVFGWSVLGLSICIIGKEAVMPVVAKSPVAQANPKRPVPSSWRAAGLITTAERHDTDSAQIRYGRELVARTAYYLGPKGKVARRSNGMNCQNCHLDAGTKLWGNNYSAVAATYPKFRERSGSKETIIKRISDCFERSLNGHSPDSASREMQAMAAYIQFVGRAVPKGETPKGTGLWPMPFLDRAADPTKGSLIYSQKCVVCHGKTGQGQPQPDGSGYIYPPLWGNHSYNTGAGLYRLSRLAGYIKTNMPLGASWETPQLTDEEAWDLAAYVNSRPRPTKVFSKDWPNVKGKPVDHPFGPYADSFPENQHKFGPFKPIQEAAKKGS